VRLYATLCDAVRRCATLCDKKRGKNRLLNVS
jgi:hypothetical protein